MNPPKLFCQMVFHRLDTEAKQPIMVACVMGGKSYKERNIDTRCWLTLQDACGEIGFMTTQTVWGPRL